MGTFDHLRGLFSGSGRTTVPISLPSGEAELHRCVACVLFGGMSKVGGDLVITNRRILFTPLNTRDVAGLLRAGLKAADAPTGASTVVGWLQGQVDRSASSIAEVTAVGSGGDGDWVRPPSIVFQCSDGSRHEFGILATRTSRTGSRQNRVVRDSLLEALRG